MQFVRSISTGADAGVDARLREALFSDELWLLLVRLSPFDRAHHLRVYDLLVAEGHDDPDLLLAALLHDVGKVDSRGRVRAFHRVGLVVLGRWAPGALSRLSRPDRAWPLHGFYLARDHARIGAQRAEAAGASLRCCAIIAAHEDGDRSNDPLVKLLIASDERAIV